MKTFIRTFQLLLVLLWSTTMIPANAKNNNSAIGYYLERASEAYQEQDLNGALGWLEKAEEEDAKNPLIYVFQATIFYDAELYGPMLGAANEILKYTSKKEKDIKALGYFQRAIAYLNLQDSTNALSDFNEGLKIEPNNTSALVRRASLYGDLGQTEAAINDYKNIIRIDPANVKAYVGLGGLAYDRKDYNEALKYIDFAINLDPSDESYRLMRAVTNIEKNEYNAAAEDILASIEVNPTRAAFDVSLLLPQQQIEKIKGKLKLKHNYNQSDISSPLLLALYAENDSDWKLANEYYQKELAISPDPAIYNDMANNEM